MVKQLHLFLLMTGGLFFQQAQAQQIDTLAFQNFELTQPALAWNFTGPVIYNSGISSASSDPANSPIGVGSSRAWETTSNSGGLILEFDNKVIPAGYDTIRMSFRLAAMNLISTGGGPDNLDYVLVQYSTDGGTIYTNRLRIRGAITDNSVWPYSATGKASVNSTPATEALFQPSASGPQTTQGYSFCEIYFKASTLSQLRVKITGRSSSSTDTWLVDNVTLTGQKNCSATTASISPLSCGTYTSPSGKLYTSTGVYKDTLTNSGGCDSIITVNLTVNQVNATVTATSMTLTAAAGADSYQWVNCPANTPVSGATSQSFTPQSDGSYAVVVTKGSCKDTSVCYTIVGTGLHKNSLEDGLVIFPNPADDHVTVRFRDVQVGVNVQLINVVGEVVYEENHTGTAEIRLPLLLAPGIYVIKLRDGAGQQARTSILKL